MKNCLKALAAAAIFALAADFSRALDLHEKILIFAAASTTDAVDELITEYQKSSKTEFATSYASSGALAKQIAEGGAEANIFISADTRSMEILEKADKIEKDTKFLFGKNSLVIAASKKAAAPVKKPEDLPYALGEGKLAMGDPKHVPAGRYGAEALRYHKVYEALDSKRQLALYADARQALNAVEMAQTDYGIVYKTDAVKSKKVNIAYTFDAKSHEPIDYPACAVKRRNTTETKAFLKFIQSGKGKGIIKKYGF